MLPSRSGWGTPLATSCAACRVSLSRKTWEFGFAGFARIFGCSSLCCRLPAGFPPVFSTKRRPRKEGVLRSDELHDFATLTGFEGTEEEWEEQYAVTWANLKHVIQFYVAQKG